MVGEPSRHPWTVLWPAVWVVDDVIDVVDDGFDVDCEGVLVTWAAAQEAQHSAHVSIASFIFILKSSKPFLAV